MTYKSNFEPYISQSPNRRVSFYDEAIDPLCTLYPVLNSPKSPEFSPLVGYNHHYWCDVYTTRPESLDENQRGALRKVNDSRLVSKLRRLLTREQQSRRRFFSNSTTHS